MDKHKGSVVVGMSGGVDSSVSAYLLKKQGFDVKGLFMKNWQTEPGEECTSEIDYNDASNVCDQLDIPLHKANFSNQYWDNVFESFLAEHKKGRTPNPDILCNREIKFKSFLHYAEDIGADFIATGHYAKLINDDNHIYLARAIDDFKDQTYFLHEVNENQLKNCIFPLADLTKTDVREIALKAKLPVAKKKDSVGICFIGERNLKDFLGRFISLKPGLIRDNNGQVIGKHNGSALYTIGQRQGLYIGGIKGMKELPWYVYKKDTLSNEIFVCQGVDNPLLFSNSLRIKNIKWINDINYNLPLSISLQIRHQHKPIKALLKKQDDMYIVDFSEPIRAITPGQSAVFYKDNICLGGGVII